MHGASKNQGARDEPVRASADAARAGFGRLYGGESAVFRAPGRVNLIGEHTDYNDGFVMPVALHYATWVAAGPRSDAAVHVYSENCGDETEFELAGIEAQPSGHWSDYARGVAGVLVREGVPLRGTNLYIAGDVPLGAGLSSSASLEVACAFALLHVAGATLDRRAVARACQRAEHENVGTKCGIMDQTVACFGRAGHALLLDCRSLEFELLPLPPEAMLAICDSGVKHELAGGAYNERLASCEQGVALLRPRLPGIAALRDVSPEDLERNRSALPDTVYRRCRHVCTENQRVTAAAERLRAGDLAAFGRLMNQSHISLRDDYEVSCRELDLLVEIAQSCEGVLGARMTGGGFGGCTVNLVRPDPAEQFTETVRAEYERVTGRVPAVYVCSAADGAGPA